MPKTVEQDFTLARGKSFVFTVSEVYPRVIEDSDNDFITVEDTKGYTYLMLANDVVIPNAQLKVEIKGRFTTLLRVIE